MNSLISAQSSTGYWNDEGIILSYLTSIKDDSFDEVQTLIKEKGELMSVWLTILALYILNIKFKNKEDEWKMIARKSTIYLK